MALQVEIWVKSIIEGLFANNTFAARSVDHSEFVNEKTVHVPNAGAAPNVEKNRTVFPANVTERKDVDLTYQMDEFTVDPVHNTRSGVGAISWGNGIWKAMLG